MSKGRKSTTVKSYISAIKAVLRQDGVEMNEDKYLLTSLTKACQYVNGVVRTRLPIQRGLCGYLVKQTEEHFQDLGQPYLAALYTLIFASSYYVMLRIGEVTMGAHPIKVKDVRISKSKKKIAFILRSSKTHWMDTKPQTIKITSSVTGRDNQDSLEPELRFCPYQLIKRYMSFRKWKKSKLEPFYVFQDRSPVKPFHVRTVLKKMLTLISLDAANYGTHSFRIGRSIDLYHAQVEIATIKKLPRWTSNIMYVYLK